MPLYNENLNPFTATEIEPEVTEAAELGLGASDLHHRSFANESLGYMALFGDNLPDGIRDKSFVADEANIPSTIHPRFRKSLMEDSVSEQHFAEMIPHYERMSAEERYLESQSWYSQLGYGILPELTNAPLYLAAAFAMPATTAVAGSTVASAAIVSGLGDMAVEGIKDVVGTHDKTTLDYLAAGVIGGAAGGIFGRTKNVFEEQAEKEMKSILGVDEATEKELKKAGSVDKQKEILKTKYEETTGKKATETTMQTLDNLVNKKGIAEKMWEAGRQDLAYMTGQSTSRTFADFSSQMFPDPTLQNLAKDRRDFQTARDKMEAAFEGQIQQGLNSKVKEFGQVVGRWTFMGRPVGSTYDEYGDLIGYARKHMDDGSIGIEDATRMALQAKGYNFDENLFRIVKEGIEETNKITKYMGEELKKQGNYRFIDQTPRDNYYHFVYNKKKITSLLNQGVKKEDIQNAIKNSMRAHAQKQGKELDEELLTRASRAFYDSISEGSMDSSGTFKDLLRELSSNATDPVDKAFYRDLIEPPKIKEGDKSSPMRQRSAIDYKHETILKDSKGNEHKFSMIDLIDDNYYTSARKYYRKTIGSTMLQKFKFKTRKSFVSEDEIKARLDLDEELVRLRNMDAEIEKYKAMFFNQNMNKDQIFKAIEDTLNIDMQDYIDLPNRIKAREEALRSDILDEQIAERVYKGNKSGYILGYTGLNRETKQLAALQKKLGRLKRQSAIDATKQKIEKLEKSIAAKQEMLDVATRNIRARYGDDAEEILSELTSMSERYIKSGADIFEKAKEIFKEQYNTNRVSYNSPQFKEIHKRLKEENKVDISDLDNKVLSKLEDTNFEERSLTTYEDIEAFRNQVQGELQLEVDSKNISKDKMHADLVRLNHILKDMNGIPTAKDPNGGAAKAQRLIASYNIARLLGSTLYTMFAEGAMTIADAGVKNMARSVPTLVDLLKAYRSGKITRADALELQDEFGVYTEFFSNPRQYELDHEFAPDVGRGEKVYNKAMSIAEHAAEFTMMIGGLKPLTALYRTAMIKGIHSKLQGLANGKKMTKGMKKLVDELGLSDESLELVLQQIRTHSDGNLMNYKAWDNSVKDILTDGINRRMHTQVQHGTLGDKLGWVIGSDDYIVASTVSGKLAMELKSFAFTAYTKQLGRVIKRNDLYTTMLVASAAAGLTVANIAKNHVNYYDDEDKRDENLEIGNLSKAVIGQLPIASLFPQMIDISSNIVTGEPVFGVQSHSNPFINAISQFPALDAPYKLMSGIFAPMQDVFKDELEPSSFKDTFKATGLKNNWITRPFVEDVLND